MQSYLDAALAVQTSVLCMLTFVWCAPVLDTLKQLVVEVIRQRLGRLFRPTCIAVAAAVCLVSLMGYKSEERRDWHIDCSVLSLASLVLVFRLVSLLHERQAAENEATKQRRLAANKSELARTLSENNRQLHSAAEDMRKQGFLHTSESQRLFNTAPGRDVERIQHFVEQVRFSVRFSILLFLAFLEKQNSQLRTANKKLLGSASSGTRSCLMFCAIIL
ncbi:MAG: hypothetical protein MHM6MM_006713 [Cercozoa sp. M6MM]